MKTKNEDIDFLLVALDFFSSNWESDEKCTQEKIANRLGKSSSYLSKAKDNNDYAKNLRRDLLHLVDELGGSFSKEQNAFLDKDGTVYPINAQEEEVPNFLKLQKGITSAFFFEKLSKTRNIQVLITWAGETYGQIIKTFEESPHLFNTIRKIEILMLHPNSYGAYLRSKDLDEHTEKGFKQIKEDLEQIINTPQKIRNKIEVRLYNQLPSVRLIMLDNLYTASYFLSKQSSRLGHQIMFNPREQKEFAVELKKHFHDVWKNAEPFDYGKGTELLNEWKKPTYKRYNKTFYHKFTGSYYLYFPERYSSIPDYKNHKIITSIGCGILEIYEKEAGHYFCRYKSSTSKGDDLLQGELINQDFNNRDILIVNLKNKYKDRFITLKFYMNGGKIRKINFGVSLGIYGSSGEIGSGLVLLCPTEKDFNSLDGEGINPREILNDENNVHFKNLGINGICYLTRKKESLLIPKNHHEEIKEHLKITGTFKIYAYSQSRRKVDQQQITIGVLEILPTGWVRFKNRLGGYHGVGWADKEQSNLYINIVNSSPDIPRKALFIFQVGSNPSPREQGESYIYCGVSTSTTWVEGNPAGARVILEHCPGENYDDLTPMKLTTNQPDFTEIPKSIQRALLGEADNFISFSKKGGRIFSKTDLEKDNETLPNYQEIFFKNFCFDVLEKNYDSSINNLKKSISYGFENFTRMYDFLNKYNVDDSSLLEKIKLLEQELFDIDK